MCDKMNAHYNKFFNETVVKAYEGQFSAYDPTGFLKPVFKSTSDNSVSVGMKLPLKCPVPGKLIPEDILSKLHHIEQHLHWTLELGTSIDEVMNSGKSMLECAHKGFRIEHKHCLISNLKKVFLHILKDENTQFMGPLMMMAPATMLSFDGKVHLELDDFDELANHPMAQPLMMSFAQLFEGMMG